MSTTDSAAPLRIWTLGRRFCASNIPEPRPEGHRWISFERYQERGEITVYLGKDWWVSLRGLRGL